MVIQVARRCSSGPQQAIGGKTGQPRTVGRGPPVLREITLSAGQIYQTATSDATPSSLWKPSSAGRHLADVGMLGCRPEVTLDIREMRSAQRSDMDVYREAPDLPDVSNEYGT